MEPSVRITRNSKAKEKLQSKLVERAKREQAMFQPRVVIGPRDIILNRETVKTENFNNEVKPDVQDGLQENGESVQQSTSVGECDNVSRDINSVVVKEEVKIPMETVTELKVENELVGIRENLETSENFISGLVESEDCEPMQDTNRIAIHVNNSKTLAQNLVSSDRELNCLGQKTKSIKKSPICGKLRRKKVNAQKDAKIKTLQRNARSLKINDKASTMPILRSGNNSKSVKNCKRLLQKTAVHRSQPFGATTTASTPNNIMNRFELSDEKLVGDQKTKLSPQVGKVFPEKYANKTLRQNYLKNNSLVCASGEQDSRCKFPKTCRLLKLCGCCMKPAINKIKNTPNTKTAVLEKFGLIPHTQLEIRKLHGKRFCDDGQKTKTELLAKYGENVSSFLYVADYKMKAAYSKLVQLLSLLPNLETFQLQTGLIVNRAQPEIFQFKRFIISKPLEPCPKLEHLKHVFFAFVVPLEVIKEVLSVNNHITSLKLELLTEVSHIFKMNRYKKLTTLDLFIKRKNPTLMGLKNLIAPCLRELKLRLNNILKNDLKFINCLLKKFEATLHTLQLNGTMFDKLESFPKFKKLHKLIVDLDLCYFDKRFLYKLTFRLQALEYLEVRDCHYMYGNPVANFKHEDYIRSGFKDELKCLLPDLKCVQIS